MEIQSRHCCCLDVQRLRCWPRITMLTLFTRSQKRLARNERRAVGGVAANNGKAEFFTEEHGPINSPKVDPDLYIFFGCASMYQIIHIQLFPDGYIRSHSCSSLNLSSDSQRHHVRGSFVFHHPPLKLLIEWITGHLSSRMPRSSRQPSTILFLSSFTLMYGRSLPSGLPS